MDPSDESGGAERLLTDLTARFTRLPVERIHEEIERGLRQLVEYLDTDRSTLFEFSPDGRHLTAAASWARPGIEPYTTPIVPAELPWYHAQLVRGETVRVRLPDELPEDAGAEKAYMRRLGMQSNLTIPIRVGEHPVCALATGAFRTPRDWPDRVVERLRLVGHIFANALYRERVETELRAAVTALDRQKGELEARVDEIHRLKTQLEAETVYLRTEIRREKGFDAIVGQSPAILEVLAKVAQVAPTTSAVLVLGETGTGKELLAHAIHDRSPRRHGPLVKVSCAALPPTLIESELFGHEKGAFTGATGAKVGRFELADGGTLFLDEIGELTPDLQVKLLRVLQHGEFERVGSGRPRRVDVRIVAATHRDLERAMADGRFREDLYFRLSVFPIRLPPLRARREDIPLLVWHYITRRQAKLGRTIERVPTRAMAALTAYAWPGNVRELENVIERALILSPGSTLHLEEPWGAKPRSAGGPPSFERLDEVERAHIRRVLDACAWKIEGPGHAAATLGLNPGTLRSRMAKLGIRRPARPAEPG